MFFMYTKPYTLIRRGEWGDLLVSTSLCPTNLMTVVPAKKRKRGKVDSDGSPIRTATLRIFNQFFSSSWLNFPRYLAHFLPPYESRLQKPFGRPCHNSTNVEFVFFCTSTLPSISSYTRARDGACVRVSLLHKMWPQKPFLLFLHKSINIAVEWADMIIIVPAREILLHRCTAGSVM
jgi:hypothetical protein